MWEHANEGRNLMLGFVYTFADSLSTCVVSPVLLFSMPPQGGAYGSSTVGDLSVSLVELDN